MSELRQPAHGAVEDDAEEESVEEAQPLPARLIYEVIRRNGEEELRRPTQSLVFSGLAAGLVISFSVIGEAILRAHLPDEPWRFLVENLGYSLGFLMVILGRMQLFTENTITTILPLMTHPTRGNFLVVARLWAIVLAANVAGALIAAVFIAHGGVFDAGVSAALRDLSHHAMQMGPVSGFMRAIPAGVLVASIVWMLPTARGSGFSVILVFTWLIAAGDFAHVVAGSVEMWLLLVTGGLSPLSAAAGFFFPVLAGNIVGGSLVFSLIAWGQVQTEVRD
jgi:formate/nitrite transporter FocA (FNT family)